MREKIGAVNRQFEKSPEIFEDTNQREITMQSLFHVFESSLNEVSSSYLSREKNIEENVTTALNELSMHAVGRELEIVQFFLDTYTGEKNKNIWSQVNSDHIDPNDGEDRLILLFFSNPSIQKLVLQNIEPNEIHTIFSTIMSKYEERLSYEREDEFGDTGMGDDTLPHEKNLFDYHGYGRNSMRMVEEEANSYEMGMNLDFPIINNIIRDLGKFGSKETIDKIFDLMSQEGAGVTRYAIQACDHIDADYTLKKIIILARDIQEDEPQQSIEYRRDFYSTLLDRSVLRNKTSEVVNGSFECLGTRYEFSGTDIVTAKILTEDDKIGLFDSQGVLKGYVAREADDIFEQVKKSDVRSLDIPYLYFASEADTAQVKIFQEEYLHFFTNTLPAQGLTMDLSRCTLHEQVWLYNFWMQASEEDRAKAITLINTFTYDAVALFALGDDELSSIGSVMDIATDTSIQDSAKVYMLSSFRSLMKQLGDISSEIDFLSPGHIQDRDVVYAAQKDVYNKAIRLVQFLCFCGSYCICTIFDSRQYSD